MQIESLKVFCDLAETKSFTITAQINGVTQSAISQQISSLERRLLPRKTGPSRKKWLIERTRRTFRLTREGQTLYQHGKQAIAIYNELQTRLKETREMVSGSIRVATIYSIGLHDLPPCLKRFLKTYPTVNVQVEYRRANQVYEDVMGNAVDLGLVAYPVRVRKLAIYPLRKDPLVVICHPQHPLARQRNLRLETLNKQKLISFEPDIPTRKALDKLLKGHSVEVQHVMEFDNIETVKRAVEIDAGIAIVPQSTVIQEVKQGTLAQVTLQDGEFYRPLAAILRKNKILSAGLKEFLAVLKGEQ
ncbi:MAG TPA: LysR substrate-binding domain-containing protein [Verrucomicrobiota bacterium]|jgi:DNA-binding transcriptional LysR family regulator|nr:LysR substrate-binding domain-containing protein [Verrucomicrobiota bacterium]HQL76672.1 LysR substrate-binding domain-containing protein [Verrucomicrobiota bacterium]